MGRYRQWWRILGSVRDAEWRHNDRGWVTALPTGQRLLLRNRYATLYPATGPMWSDNEIAELWAGWGGPLSLRHASLWAKVNAEIDAAKRVQFDQAAGQ